MLYKIKTYIFAACFVKNTVLNSQKMSGIEEESDIREGKERRLGDRIDSIPFCTRNLGPGCLK